VHTQSAKHRVGVGHCKFMLWLKNKKKCSQAGKKIDQRIGKKIYIFVQSVFKKSFSYIVHTNLIKVFALALKDENKNDYFLKAILIIC